MNIKKTIKYSLFALFIFFSCTGVYALTDKVKQLSVFTVSNVEVKGVSNADRVQLTALGNKLIGLNIFDERISALMVSDDPWVQKLTANRVMPSTISLVVFEEIALFSYQTKNGKCYVYTADNKQLGVSCEGVIITADKALSVEKAAEFVKILEKYAVLKDSTIKLGDYSFEARINGELIYCPYDAKIFEQNYEIYSSTLRPVYKKVEYADLTVSERIFVKGERSGTKQG